MYVVFELNGVQYDGKIGDEVVVDLMDSAEKKIKISNVLLAKKNVEDVVIGKPYIDGAEIHAEYLNDVKDKKVIVFKYKPRKKYRNKNGHRQNYSVIKLISTNLDGEVKAEVKAQ